MYCVLNSKCVGCGCGGAATRKEVGGKCVNARRRAFGVFVRRVVRVEMRMCGKGRIRKRRYCVC